MRRRTDTSPTGRPRMRADPRVGKISCISSFSVVLLPAPLGPRKPKTSPASTLRVSASSARYGRGRQKPTRKSLVKPSVSIAGIGVVGGYLPPDTAPQLPGDGGVEELAAQTRQPHAVHEEGRRAADLQLRALRDVGLHELERAGETARRSR